MIRDVIKIRNGTFFLSGHGDVWMTCEEIADILGMLAATVRKNATRYTGRYSDNVKSLPLGNNVCTDVYSLEVIIALAHITDTANTRLFRKWIAEEMAYARKKKDSCIIVDLKTSITE